MINVILDPSILLKSDDLEYFVNIAEENKKNLNIYLPSIFFRGDRLNEQQRNNVIKFFKIPFSISPEFNPFEVGRYLGRIKNVRDAPDFAKNFKKHQIFLENLRSHVVNPEIYQILAEEWVFMNEYSHIVSRIKKGFDKFMQAGASYLIIGKNSMEKYFTAAINKANKSPLDASLTAFGIFRASAKFIAAGGSSIGTTVISGNVGIGVAAASGLFLIMDP